MLGARWVRAPLFLGFVLVALLSFAVLGAGCGAREAATGRDGGPADEAATAARQDGSQTGVDAFAGTGDASIPSTACSAYFGASSPTTTWAHPDGKGQLAYGTTSNGDRMMDFSFAGYRAGGVAWPTAPVMKTLKPSGGDDTAAIQAAINAVAALPLSDAGVRGAVLLAPGNFTIGGTNTLEIGASGVVLRGSGAADGGTTLTVSGTARDPVLRVGGGGSLVLDPTAKAQVTDAYVPSGTNVLTLDHPELFAVGDPVVVVRPVTAPWVAFEGEDDMIRNDAGETWLAPGTVLYSERVIAAINGDKTTLDAPLSDSLDAKYLAPPGASIAKYSFSGRITGVGLEHFRAVCPARTATTEFGFLREGNAEDSWISDVALHNFTNGVWIEGGGRRITVDRVAVTHDATTYFTSEAPFDFSIDGSQILVSRSSSTGGNKIWYLATQRQITGPNVALDFAGSGLNSHVSSHDRWATGFLVDRPTVDGGITLHDNGNLGNGQGWTMAWGLVWNGQTDTDIGSPPGAVNWGIGCVGSGTGDGTYVSQGTPVAMSSLYLAQLCARLGPSAVAQIGY